MNHNTAILPLLTIGLTAYNAEDSIEKAVRSAAAQNWTPVEIIAVNDASTDRTAEILGKLTEEIQNLRVFNLSKNKGVAGARNTIIHEANGIFLAFFDDDDQSDPQRLRKQYMRIVAYEERFAGQAEVLCHTARIQSYPDGTERYEPTVGTNKDGRCPRGEAMARRILYGAPLENGFGSMATCAQMARLTTYQTLDGFDENFRRFEDTDFNVRFALNGGHFVGIAEPLVRQNMTPGGEKTLNEEETYYRNLIIKHAIFIRNNGTSPLFCARWQEAKYLYLRGKKLGFLWKMMRLALKYPRLCYLRLKWAWPNRKYNEQAQAFYRTFS